MSEFGVGADTDSGHLDSWPETSEGARIPAGWPYTVAV